MLSRSEAQLRQQIMAQILQNAGSPSTIGQGISSAGRSIAGAISGRRALADEHAQQAKMGELLMGTPSTQPSLPGATPGGVRGFTPARPGMMGDVDPRLIEAMVASGRGDELLTLAAQRAMPQPGEGFTLGEGDVRFDAQGRQVAAGPAGVAEPPKTRDVLQGGERVFQQYDPATGQWTEVGRGPAFAPPTQVNVNTERAPAGYRFDEGGNLAPIQGGPAEQTQGSAAIAVSQGPGMITDIQDLVSGLINPDGSLNQKNLATMNVPLIGAVPGTEGSALDSKVQGIVANMLYIKSGATAGPSEVATQSAVYMPSISDSPAAVRDKLARLDRDARSIIMNYAKGARDDFALPEVTIPAVGSEPGIGDQLLGGIVGKARDALGSAAGAVSGAMAGASDIASMTLDQLTKMDPANMTPEQLRAAAARYSTLGGQ